MLGRRVCYLKVCSSVPSAFWSISVMSVMSFFLLIWAVVFFLFPSVRKDLWYSSHILAVLPLLFLFTFFERGRAAPCASFCALGQFCCVVFWPWTLSCLSTQRSPLDCETNEKSEMTASERKWFVLWRETWKDVPPRTRGALFSLLSTAGLTHFKITILVHFGSFRQMASQYSREEGKRNKWLSG